MDWMAVVILLPVLGLVLLLAGLRRLVGSGRGEVEGGITFGIGRAGSDRDGCGDGGDGGGD